MLFNSYSPPISLQSAAKNGDQHELGEFIEAEQTEPEVDQADFVSLQNRISAALDDLGYRDREILRLRYGLGDGFCYTLGEIASIFRLTKERVRQLEDRALRKLYP